MTKGRPAETITGVGGLGAIVAGVVAHQWPVVVTGCLGFVPGAVTFVVTHGGLKGMLNSIWKGGK